MKQSLTVIIAVKVSWIFVFLTCTTSIQGTVMISPSGIAPACSGGHLDVTCTTNGTFLRWHITRPDIENDASTRSFTRTISSLGLASSVAPLMIVNTTFSFSRTSHHRTLPLISRLTISPVGEIMNGTQVKCQDVITNINSSTTIVHVIYSENNVGSNITDNEVIFSYSEHFYSNNISIIINFSHENPLVLLTVNISAAQQLVLEGLHSPIILELQYNTDYNVTVVASICGHIIATKSVKLFYGICKNPLSAQYSSRFLTVTGYKVPAKEGTNITLHCTSGLQLIGPSTSMCMGNGEWEPDPREAECKLTTANCEVPPPPSPHGHILPYSNTHEGAEVVYICWDIHQEENISQCTEANTTAVCNEHGNWEPKSHDLCSIFSRKLTESGSLDVLRAAVSSTVVAFLVISLLIFATGFVCGHYFGRKSKQPPTETPDHPSASQTEVPLYEDVTLSAVEQQEGLEMRENVAYGPL